MDSNDALDVLATAVAHAPKYRHITPDLVRRIGARELAVRGSHKAALKATKNKLHQIGGAYFDKPIDYEWALAQLQETAASPAVFRATCRDLMRLHTSTRERLPILEEFYSTIFAALPPVRSVLDVACGLNPLALPWMRLAPGATYFACDIYTDMMVFLQHIFDLIGLAGTAAAQDVIGTPPTQPVDVAFILKTLPVLERVETAVPHLLDSLNARHLLITFPVRSLGGRRKGMVANYTAQFEQWADGRSWHVQRFDFETELAFLVEQG